jgi:hypothetical protein
MAIWLYGGRGRDPRVDSHRAHGERNNELIGKPNRAGHASGSRSSICIAGASSIGPGPAGFRVGVRKNPRAKKKGVAEDVPLIQPGPGGSLAPLWAIGCYLSLVRAVIYN